MEQFYMLSSPIDATQKIPTVGIFKKSQLAADKKSAASCFYAH